MNAYELLNKLLVCAKAHADRKGLPFDGLSSTQLNQLKRVLSDADVLATMQPSWPIRTPVQQLNMMAYSNQNDTPYVVIAVGGGVPDNINPYGHATDFDDLDPFTSYMDLGLIKEDDDGEDDYDGYDGYDED